MSTRPSAAQVAPLGRQRLTLARAGATSGWARHVAEHLQIPLATVLAWSPDVLEAEIARAIVALAREQAQRLCAPLGPEEPPREAPAGDDLLSVATRAIVARIRAVQDADEAAEQAAAWDALEAELR